MLELDFAPQANLRYCPVNIAAPGWSFKRGGLCSEVVGLCQIGTNFWWAVFGGQSLFGDHYSQVSLHLRRWQKPIQEWCKRTSLSLLRGKKYRELCYDDGRVWFCMMLNIHHQQMWNINECDVSRKILIIIIMAYHLQKYLGILQSSSSQYP